MYCFLLCLGLFVFGGFVYAIASAACEFLYLRNTEFYNKKIKKKTGKVA